MTKMLTMRLSDDDHARLTAQAKKEYTSMAGLLMRLFAQYMDKVEPQALSKDDGKAPLRQAYDQHLATLTRDIVLHPDDSMAWKHKLSLIQKAYGKDGVVMLPFPVDEWNSLASRDGKPIAPVIETPEELDADLKKLAELCSR